MSDIKDKIWFRLDNAAKIYPSLINSRTSTVFRVSCTLMKPVDVDNLKTALEKTLVRFPFFNVVLKKGFFWNYFEQTDDDAVIFQDSKYPCTYIPVRHKRVRPFRVRVYYTRIALEVSHALTDGTGALTFLNCLVYNYLLISGSIKENTKLNIFNSMVIPDEYEDGFKKNFINSVPLPAKPGKAFQIQGALIEKSRYIITNACMSAQDIKAKAKEYNTTVTNYLLAVFIETFLEYISQNKCSVRAPLRIMVPVNLRQLFESRTLLNFFLTIGPEIDYRLGYYTFDEILSQIQAYTRLYYNRKFLLQQIKRNVGGELSPFVRSIPLFFKNFIMPVLYQLKGQSVTTSTISNLGINSILEPYNNLINRFDFIPAPNAGQKIGVGIITYNNTLSINFGRLIENSDIEKIFIRKLVKNGIKVTIESNEVE